jgi:UrcA family protein
MLQRLIASAALAAGLALAQGALAQPQSAEEDQPRQVAVRYDDLNLTTAVGADEMKHRIDFAAKSVCGGTPDIRDLGATWEFEKCLSGAESAALAQLSDIEARATVQVANR